MRNLTIKKRILNSVTVHQRMVERYFESWQKRLVPGQQDQYIPFTAEEVEHIRLINDRLAALTIDTLEQACRICDDLKEKTEQGNNDYEGFKLKALIKMNGHHFLMDDPDEMLLRIHYAKDFELAELTMDHSREDRYALLAHLKRLYVEDNEQTMMGWGMLSRTMTMASNFAKPSIGSSMSVPFSHWKTSCSCNPTILKATSR